MTRSRSITFLATATALVFAALAVAGCGSNASGSSAPPKTANGQSATVGVANENLGKILVNSQGRTLYVFQRDSGTKSTCTGACAIDWPPLRATGKATVGGGANASIVATSARSDGKSQVTYNGHPLYLFSGDQKPGDTNGQGVNAFGALWYVLSSSGNEVTTSAGSGGGLGY
jgi:predicted lipoprotein with Yx(FWY)xxD motif